MKFCYIDESGTGNEPFAVMVGIIVDAQRMHVTKSDWADLLNILSNIVNREVNEIHTRDFTRVIHPGANFQGMIELVSFLQFSIGLLKDVTR